LIGDWLVGWLIEALHRALTYRHRLALDDSKSGWCRRLSDCQTAENAVDTGSRPVCRLLVFVFCRYAAPPASYTSAPICRHVHQFSPTGDVYYL